MRFGIMACVVYPNEFTTQIFQVWWANFQKKLISESFSVSGFISGQKRHWWNHWHWSLRLRSFSHLIKWQCHTFKNFGQPICQPFCQWEILTTPIVRQTTGMVPSTIITGNWMLPTCPPVTAYLDKIKLQRTVNIITNYHDRCVIMVYSLCLMRQRWNITSRQSLLRHLSWTAATLSFATRTTYATTNIESSIQKPSLARHFFIIQQESGKIRRDLPLWASKVEDPFGFGVSNETCQARTIERREVDQVPGAFQLINFMTPEETKRIGEFLCNITQTRYHELLNQNEPTTISIFVHMRLKYSRCIQWARIHRRCSSFTPSFGETQHEFSVDCRQYHLRHSLEQVSEFVLWQNRNSLFEWTSTFGVEWTLSCIQIYRERLLSIPLRWFLARNKECQWFNSPWRFWGSMEHVYILDLFDSGLRRWRDGIFDRPTWTMEASPKSQWCYSCVNKDSPWWCLSLSSWRSPLALSSFIFANHERNQIYYSDRCFVWTFRDVGRFFVTSRNVSFHQEGSKFW